MESSALALRFNIVCILLAMPFEEKEIQLCFLRSWDEYQYQDRYQMCDGPSFKTSSGYQSLGVSGSSHFQSFVFEIQTNGHVIGTT